MGTEGKGEETGDGGENDLFFRSLDPPFWVFLFLTGIAGRERKQHFRADWDHLTRSGNKSVDEAVICRYQTHRMLFFFWSRNLIKISITPKVA